MKTTKKQYCCTLDMVRNLSECKETFIAMANLLWDKKHKRKKITKQTHCSCKVSRKGHSAGTLLNGKDLIICNDCGKTLFYGDK